MNKKIVLRTFLHAIIAVAYIFGVAFLMSSAERIFGKEPNVFGPAVFLLLFVLSAAVMSILVFGKPTLLYLDNQKKEALIFLFYTIGWLLVALAAIFCFLIIF